MIQTSLAKRWKPRNAVHNVLLIECKTVVDGSKKIVVTRVSKIYLLQQLFVCQFLLSEGQQKNTQPMLKPSTKAGKPIVARDIKTRLKFNL